VSVTFAASEPLVQSRVSAHHLDDRRRLGAGDGKIVAPSRSCAGGRAGARRARALWPVLGLLAVAGCALFALARPAIVLGVWPRLADAYAAVGLEVNLRGFEFAHVTARFEDVGAQRFLSVEGVLRNVSKEMRDAPRLRVTLSDAQARPVYFWAATSGVKALPPGEAAPFRARLAAPPPEAQSVTVDFMP
jgi:hypothetical protein